MVKNGGARAGLALSVTVRVIACAGKHRDPMMLRGERANALRKVTRSHFLITCSCFCFQLRVSAVV
jgi:hypothetical protein